MLMIFGIVPFPKDFSPSGKQLEHRKLAQISRLYRNISQILLPYKMCAVLQQIWLYEIIGGTLSMCQNTTMG